MFETILLFTLACLIGNASAQTATPWTDRIEFSGDVRFRHEYVNKSKASDTSDAHRERLRLRFGASAKINDVIKAKFRLSTSDGQNPLGPNATFTNNGSKKGIYVDIGSFEWNAFQGGTLVIGKMENPFRILNQSQMIFDIDYTPEGGALLYQAGNFFAKAAGFVLEERAQQANGTSEPDSWLHAGLVGYKFENPDGFGYMAAAGFYNFTSLKNNTALYVTNTTNFYGNSTNAAGTRYAHDYQVGQIIGEVRRSSASDVWIVYVDALQNFKVDELNKAILVGATYQTLNENRKPVWTFGYAYETTEKDATVSALNYSDIANGIDGHFGHIAVVGRTLAPNTSLNLTFTHAYVDGLVANGGAYWADRGTLDALVTF